MKKESSPFRDMASKWPSTLSRNEITHFSGGLISINYISNLDSAPPRTAPTNSGKPFGRRSS